MNYVSPSDLLNAVYDEELGFRLTNFSVKGARCKRACS